MEGKGIARGDGLVRRAGRAARALCREMALIGKPASRDHLRRVVRQSRGASPADPLAEPSELQLLVRDYLRRAMEAEGLDDLYEGDRMAALLGVTDEEAPLVASWPLCEALCEASRAAESPAIALALSRRAVALATSLQATSRHRGHLSRPAASLLAYSLAHQGNALRRADDLQGAGRCFARMHSTAVTDGSGIEWDDDREGHCAIALYLEASYLRTVRRLPEAIQRLTLCLELLASRSTHPPRLLLLAKSLISLAKALEDSGNPEASIHLLELCRAELGNRLRSNPHLWYCLHHNLCVSLALAGRHTEARLLLPLVYLLRRHPNTRDLGAPQLLWLEGHLAWLEGDQSGALAQLERARQAFVAAGEAYDVALVSLEMAAHYVELGDHPRVHALVAEMLPIFAARGIDRETLAAIGFLSVTLARDVEEQAALDRVRLFLRRARFDATQLFFPPA